MHPEQKDLDACSKETRKSLHSQHGGQMKLDLTTRDRDLE